ncbi:MAG: DUF3293 domain-containing protein [Wenzhouxiangella sp.]
MTATAKPSMTDCLLDAFLNTDYLVHCGEQVVVVHVGQGHPALDKQIDASSWAIITADNPGAIPASDASNLMGTQLLDEAINKAGLKSLPTTARATKNAWPDEHGRLVIDPQSEWVHAMARQLGQLGVVCGLRDGVAELWLLDDRMLSAGHAHVHQFSP